MPQIDIDGLRKRVQNLKAGLWRDETSGRVPLATEGAISSTLGILALVYGNPSPQLQHFQEQAPRGRGGANEWDVTAYNRRMAKAIEAVLDSALADLESGLTSSIRVLATGEVLGDFVGLAREVRWPHARRRPAS